MRLSVVFELLLVFLFLAFAAARVVDRPTAIKNVAKSGKKTTTLRQGPPNRYCACTSRMCNCCRDFSLPVVPIKGPGCASIMYVQRDTMMVTMSFGDRVLSNTTISGKTPKPICMALPGGISQFCGRIYGISRKGDQFRACLGLELRALDDIEAALRVSCFKFGPKGVKLESAPPVPAESGGKDPDEEEEDDYDLDEDDDDIIGFGVDDEDDGASSEDNEVESDSVDYTGFSVLGEDILGTLFSDDSGSSSAKKKKPSKKTAKPQVLVPKISTTTRRPILPTRRRSTTKPLNSVTKRPLLNRITKRPSIIQRPSVPIIVSPQTTASPATITQAEYDKKVVTKPKTTTTTTEAPPTTMKITTTMQSHEEEKVVTSEEKLTQETAGITEEPITFIIPTQKTEITKNDIKLPQTDLAKLEAVAAIAQQDVTSGVIPSSSLTTEEAKKPVEIVTVKYEKLTPTFLTETTPYFLEPTEKINSVKFVPTTSGTFGSTAGVAGESIIFNKVAETVAFTNSEPEIISIKNKINTHQQTINSSLNDEKKVNMESNIKDKETSSGNLATKKGNYTVSFKKQPEKKPEKEENEEEDEEEEEDLLEGVLSDDDDSDNEEVETNEGNSPSQTSSNINNVDDANNDEDEEEDDDEDDILGETVETSQQIKPSKISIKKKPESNDTKNKDEEQGEEEEEEEEEEDILDVLGDDDDEEETEDYDDDDNEEPEKQKHKKKPTTQATTKIKKPTTQQIIVTRKPVGETEKIQVSATPEDKIAEKITEKIFIYKEPAEKVTENTPIMYQDLEIKIPEKIFIYKDPENHVTQKTTEKVIFYKEPSDQFFTDKFVIYKEPEEKNTIRPATVIHEGNKSSEETKDDSEEEEKGENYDEGSSEEDSEDDNEKHTLMASVVKPGFSNKYGEEHDLTENDDLDIEDSEDEEINFDEDRQMKDQKKLIPKSPDQKLEVPVTKPKVLTLSDLINQRKKFMDRSKDDKPISTSRTHRRMNLDRLLQV